LDIGFGAAGGEVFGMDELIILSATVFVDKAKTIGLHLK